MVVEKDISKASIYHCARPSNSWNSSRPLSPLFLAAREQGRSRMTDGRQLLGVSSTYRLFWVFPVTTKSMENKINAERHTVGACIHSGVTRHTENVCVNSGIMLITNASFRLVLHSSLYHFLCCTNSKLIDISNSNGKYWALFI